MVYNRVRNSRYASYSRACNSRGLRAQFSVPMRGTANFNPMLDMLNQGVQMGGDMFGHAGQAIGDVVGGAASRMTDIPYADAMSGLGAKAGNAINGAVNYGQDFFQNAGDAIGGAVKGAGQYFTDNPMAANAAKGAAGVGGIAGGAAAAAKAVDKFGRPVAQAVEEAAPAAMGLRQRAGAMLKNPYALAAGGAGVLGAGAYGANRMMNQDQ